MRAALGYDRSYTLEMIGENAISDYTYAECTVCGHVKPCGECGNEGISHDAPCVYWDCPGVYSH